MKEPPPLPHFPRLFLNLHDWISISLHIIQVFIVAVRWLSPRDKQETADMEPLSDAHMMLIDRCSPRVLAHRVGVSVDTHPAGHSCSALEVAA